MVICQVCGNSISEASLHCRFCGSKQDGATNLKSKIFIHKVVNLERGRPLLEVALQKMDKAIADAKKNQVSVLTFIHGYGSSGKGGVICSECRKSLDFMKSNRRIRNYITGEDYSKKHGPVKILLQQYPQLEKDTNLNKGNRGITLVAL